MKTQTKSAAIPVSFVVLLTIMASCKPESQCDYDSVDRFGTGSPARSLGSFSFRHISTLDTPIKNGVTIELEFTPSPTSVPDGRCEVGFIQMVRTVSLRDPSRFHYPTSQKERRATPEGWYIDRPDGYESPIYGRNNAGPPDFPPDKVELGTRLTTTGVAARMADSPSRYEYAHLRCILWQALTVPVCLSSDKKCHEPLSDGVGLGYFAWSWIVTEDGHVADVQGHEANDSLVFQVEDALSRWNEETIWGTIECPQPEMTPATSSK